MSDEERAKAATERRKVFVPVTVLGRNPDHHRSRRPANRKSISSGASLPDFEL